VRSEIDSFSCLNLISGSELVDASTAGSLT